MKTRRWFLQRLASLLAGIGAGFTFLRARAEGKVMTVTGYIDASAMGKTLIHEHILVDFTGAAGYDPSRWNREEVITQVMPYITEAMQAGCKTLVDCTPSYLGRDVILLQRLSEVSGLTILTNTGYYGGSDPKFLPQHALEETDRQLAGRWIQEWEQGIDGTSIRPGFMKISVNPGPLSQVSQKLVAAAGLAHLRTGLTIAAHTGPAVAAFDALKILRNLGVAPEAFIWVHAQNEKDHNQFVLAARSGMWVSLDGINEPNISDYVTMLSGLKIENCLHRVLISHDAGWYEPGKPGGGNIRGYATLFQRLVPALTRSGFSAHEIQQLIERNPAEAFSIRVRKVGP